MENIERGGHLEGLELEDLNNPDSISNSVRSPIAQSGTNQTSGGPHENRRGEVAPSPRRGWKTKTAAFKAAAFVALGGVFTTAGVAIGLGTAHHSSTAPSPTSNVPGFEGPYQKGNLIITDPKILPFYTNIRASVPEISEIIANLESGKHASNYTIQSNPMGPNGVIANNSYDATSRTLNFQPGMSEVSPKDDDQNRTRFVTVPHDHVLVRGFIEMNNSLSSTGSTEDDRALMGAQIFNQSLLEAGYKSHGQGNAARAAETLLGQPQGSPGIARLADQLEPGNSAGLPAFTEGNQQNQQREALIKQINPNADLDEYDELGLKASFTEIKSAQNDQANTDALLGVPGHQLDNHTQMAILKARIAEGQRIYKDSVIGAQGALGALQQGLPVSDAMKLQTEALNESAIADFGKYYGSQALPVVGPPNDSPSHGNSTERSNKFEKADHFMLRA